MPLTPSAQRNVEARQRARRNILATGIILEGTLLYVFYIIVTRIIDAVSA